MNNKSLMQKALGDQWQLGIVPESESTSAPTNMLSPEELGSD